MKHNTQRQAAKERKAMWSQALREGRVLSFNYGMQLTAYPTIEAKDRAFAEAQAAGFPVSIPAQV